MKMPLVSIIIPVYNGANYLQDAIHSALTQTYRHIEVLVINDGSRDQGKTERIAKSFGSRIRYFKKTNGGVASALNMGIRKMKGEYFSWLSHDDTYIKDKIEREMRIIGKYKKPVIIYSDFEVINENAEKIRNEYVGYIAPRQFRLALITNTSIHGCSLLIPKICFSTVGLFNEKLWTTQDYDMWFRLSKLYAFYHVKQLLVRYRVHKNQDSCKKSAIAVNEITDLYKSFLDAIDTEEIIQTFHMSPLSFYLYYIRGMTIKGYPKIAEYCLRRMVRYFVSKESFMYTVLYTLLLLAYRCIYVLLIIKRFLGFI